MIECDHISLLESEINKFLETMNSVNSLKLIEVKYNVYNWNTKNDTAYSAMIIY